MSRTISALVFKDTNGRNVTAPQIKHPADVSVAPASLTLVHRKDFHSVQDQTGSRHAAATSVCSWFLVVSLLTNSWTRWP